MQNKADPTIKIRIGYNMIFIIDTNVEKFLSFSNFSAHYSFVESNSYLIL